MIALYIILYIIGVVLAYYAIRHLNSNYEYKYWNRADKILAVIVSLLSWLTFMAVIISWFVRAARDEMNDHIDKDD